ncbi:hypothetical protein Droror1_Dr00008307 [Drosera rotundifolia]
MLGCRVGDGVESNSHVLGCRVKGKGAEEEEEQHRQSRSRRPIISNGLQKLDNEAKIPTKLDMSAEQRKLNPSTEKSKVADEDAYKLKLEATKRKLHENYHKAETAKRQRTIQIMQIKDIPSIWQAT